LQQPTLEVCIDFKSPYAFVAHQLVWRLETQHGHRIRWHPLTLNIASFLGTATKRAGGGVTETNRSPRQWSVVKAAYQDARRYAENQGLVLKGPLKIWDSSLAGIALLWVQENASSRAHLRQFMTELFRRFWLRDCDLEDPAALKAIMAFALVDCEGFDDYALEQGKERHDHLQEVLLNKGVFGVPSFIVGKEIFFGREHLDTVLWRLEGSKGPIPSPRYPWHTGMLDDGDHGL